MELGFIRNFKDLVWLTGWVTPTEILGDFKWLTNLVGKLSKTKNPAGVAARGGVQMGLVQQTRPMAFYRLTDSAATREGLV